MTTTTETKIKLTDKALTMLDVSQIIRDFKRAYPDALEVEVETNRWDRPVAVYVTRAIKLQARQAG